MWSLLESHYYQLQHQSRELPRRANDKAGGEPLDREAQRREVDKLEMSVYKPVVTAQSFVEDIHVIHQTRVVGVK